MLTPHITDDPSDIELAAALAAIGCMLEAAGEAAPGAGPSAWRAAGRLEAQGLAAARSPRYAAWPLAARTVRAARWSKGIVGL